MAKSRSAQKVIEVAGIQEQVQTEELSGLLWKPVRCAQHYWSGENCDCPPGPQCKVLVRPEFELLFGGSRGGGKSEVGRGFLMKGNPLDPQTHTLACEQVKGRGRCSCGAAVNISYLNHPRFRALVLRKNQIDLQDWVDRARALYAPLGGMIINRPPAIEFPSGAKIILGHMADEEAYEKYMGQEFHRMVLEELTQIPSELLYQRIIASCRSTFKCQSNCKLGKCRCGALHEQVLITANPGGPGSAWVKARFISLRRKSGELVKPGEAYKDPISQLSRIYIPSRVTDNPFLMRDQQYVNQLRALPEAQRRAWLDGDWDALSGQYFTQFRPNGPIGTEPVNARHVVDPGLVPLQPWWPRTIGMDWGYKHAAVVYWACYTPNKQIVIYRERIFQGADPDYIGAEIARESAKELFELQRPMTMWISPEAVGHHKDERTVAFQVQSGINRILGPGSGYIFQPEDLEQDSGDKLDDMEKVLAWQKRSGIVIRRARNQRVDGWQWMHSLMRFTPLAQPDPGRFDNDYARELLLKHGSERYFSYCDSFKAKDPEVLPRLLITSDCRGIIEAIPGAIHEEGTEDVLKTDLIGDDCCDSLRYLCMGIKWEEERLPLQQYVAARLEQASKDNPNILASNSKFWVEDFAKKEWENQQVTVGGSYPRLSRRSRWPVQ